MTTSLWIWTVFHALGFLGSFYAAPNIRMVKICMILASLMVGIVTLGTGHTTIFLITAMPAVFVTYGSSFHALVITPPNSENEKSASDHAMEATIRLAIILSCWLTAQ